MWVHSTSGLNVAKDDCAISIRNTITRLQQQAFADYMLGNEDILTVLRRIPSQIPVILELKEAVEAFNTELAVIHTNRKSQWTRSVTKWSVT